MIFYFSILPNLIRVGGRRGEPLHSKYIEGWKEDGNSDSNGKELFKISRAS